MSKSLLIEELNRLHEIMGIKKNITNIIVEAIGGGGGKPRGSFDFNSGVKSALKKELEDSVTNWAANTARLTKKGGRATFLDLLEQGRILAKNANIDDATALYYLAKATGPESYRSLMESLSMVNRRAFNDEANLIANTVIQKQIKDGINTLFYKFDWNTVDVNKLQNVKNALGMISDDIDNTSISSSLKDDLKSFLKEQEQIMDDAMEIQSIPPATLSKNTDIGDDLDPDALIPSPSRVDITPDTSEATLESILKGYRNNPRKYPAYPQFEVTIKRMKFSKKVEDMILANYDKNYNLNEVELLQKGRDLTKGLNDKQWGWIKKTLRDTSTEKIKIMGVVKLIALVTTVSVLVPWGFTGFEISENLRSTVKGWFGLGDSDNSKEGFMKWCDTNDYECIWSNDGNPEVTVNGNTTFAEYVDGWKLI